LYVSAVWEKSLNFVYLNYMTGWQWKYSSLKLFKQNRSTAGMCFVTSYRWPFTPLARLEPWTGLAAIVILVNLLCNGNDNAVDAVACDPHCESECHMQGAGKCDSWCSGGYSLNTNTFTCMGQSHSCK